MTDAMHARAAIASILGKFPHLEADDLAALSDAYRDLGDDIEAGNVLGLPWTVFDGVPRTRAGLAAWAEETAKTLRSFPIGEFARRAYDDIIHALGFGLWSHAATIYAFQVRERDSFLEGLLHHLERGAFVNEGDSPQPSHDALCWLLGRADWSKTESGMYDCSFRERESLLSWYEEAGVVAGLDYWQDGDSSVGQYYDDVLSLIADLGL
jgi:hypothetical protein